MLRRERQSAPSQNRHAPGAGSAPSRSAIAAATVLPARGLAAPDMLADARAEVFSRLVLDLRARLESLYASGLPAADMRARKQA